MTDAGRWERVGALFEAVVELGPAERARRLGEVRSEDPGLADEVESLLAEHEGTGFIGDPPPESGPRLYGLESEHVGPYRIVRPLGRGGMGNVFLAERTTADVKQTVALKLLRLDFAEPGLLERFRVERRILARLEHPGIARLIDAGATPSGQPFYAMEFVDGVDLITYVRMRGLAIRERVALFLKVCDAVEHAHQQLVVHRDLKPGNILVPEDGRPRLLDFGIAKLIDPAEQPGGEARTARWCTPEYASPEQVRGGQVTTQSDVYALGALLYEVLAGVRPFNLAGLPPSRIEQVVGHEAPRKPSERVADDPPLRRALEGDLDTIVLKALAKEPWRRYAGVGALADDLRRYMDRKPVRARPDTWRYRTVRFAQRNRVAAIAGSALVLSLAVGLAAVSWQAAVAARERDRAEEARQRAESVSNLLIGLFEAARPEAGAADTGTARAIVTQGVARIAELAGQPAVQAQMFDALGTVVMSLDRYDEAFDLLSRGLGLRRAEFGEESTETAESMVHVARALRALSEYPASDSMYRQALGIQRRLLGPTDPAIAETLLDLAAIKPYLGRNDEARALVLEALSIRQRAFGPAHVETGRALMRVAAFARLRGDYAEALDYGRRGVAVMRGALGDDEAETGGSLIMLADIEFAAGDTAAAERLYRQGLDIQSRVLGDDNVSLGHGLSNLAWVLTARGAHAEAESLLRRNLAIQSRVMGGGSAASGAAHEALASSLAAQGRLEEAEREQRTGLRLWRETVGPEHAAVAGSIASLGQIVAERGRIGEADSLLQAAVSMRIRLNGPDHPLVALAKTQLGRVLTRAGAYIRAERNLLDAKRILESAFAKEHKDRIDLDRAFVALYEAWGRPAEAARFRHRPVP